ncbi:MAG: hypothetical protein K8U57_36660 [Planctomycetes bacterium]|nr:hypothetical protein [Planctomycetota bacterium]
MRVDILSDSTQLSTVICRTLTRHGYSCSESQVLPLTSAASLGESHPELVVVCMSPDPARALLALGEIRAATTGQIIAIGAATDPKLIVRALRGGADQFVMEEEINTDLDEVLIRQNVGNARATGRMIAVLGASGGVGASTVATNLAAVLAQSHGGCLLIDLKLETGDLASLLDIDPTYTIADLFMSSVSLDRDLFERALIAHRSGLRLLASPRRAASTLRRLTPGDSAPGITAEDLRDVLSLARTLAPYTVAEVSPTFREEQIHALRVSDIVLLIVRLDFPCLRNARRTLEHLATAGVDAHRIKVVANRDGLPHALTQSQAEQALGGRLFHLIPDDSKAMNRATNVGDPIVRNGPSSSAARSLVKLTDLIRTAIKAT